MSKLIIDTVRSGHQKGDYFWKLIGENGKFINGSRPETFRNLNDLWHNIDLVSQIKSAEVVDLTAGDKQRSYVLCQDTCPRNLSNCNPLANVVADDSSTFVCCGLSDPASRTVPEDSFRLCFVSETTDTIYDHDEVDMRDLAAVICDSLALAHRVDT